MKRPVFIFEELLTEYIKVYSALIWNKCNRLAKWLRFKQTYMWWYFDVTSYP